VAAKEFEADEPGFAAEEAPDGEPPAVGGVIGGVPESNAEGDMDPGDVAGSARSGDKAAGAAPDTEGTVLPPRIHHAVPRTTASAIAAKATTHALATFLGARDGGDAGRRSAAIRSAKSRRMTVSAMSFGLGTDQTLGGGIGFAGSPDRVSRSLFGNCERPTSTALAAGL
jgi:hypothetical protein